MPVNCALKILVCYHKPFTMPPNDDGILLPIHVGKSISSQELNMQGDNEVNGTPCDNISSKNESYCELTAIYWAWKNLRRLYPDVQYVDLHHYRRFFAFNDRKYFAVTIEKPEEEVSDYRIDAEKIIRILKPGRIILPKKLVFSSTVAEQYCMCCVSDDYRAVKKIIFDKYPDYREAFTEVMEKGNKLHICNMFIMRYDDFVKYCEWLFDVMTELEPLVPFEHYNVTQKRVFGYISERLLGVYVRKH